jgi:hypothetical protein
VQSSSLAIELVAIRLVRLHYSSGIFYVVFYHQPVI